MPYDLSLACPPLMSNGRMPVDIYVVRMAMTGGPSEFPTKPLELTPFAKASECLTTWIEVPFSVLGVTIGKVPEGETVSSCYGEPFVADSGTYIIDYVFRTQQSNWVWTNWENLANSFLGFMSGGPISVARVIGWSSYCNPATFGCSASKDLYAVWDRQRPLFMWSNGKFLIQAGWSDGTGPKGFDKNFSIGFSNYPEAVQPIKFVDGKIAPPNVDPPSPVGPNAPPAGLPAGAMPSWMNYALFGVAALVTYQLIKDEI